VNPMALSPVEHLAGTDPAPALVATAEAPVIRAAAAGDAQAFEQLVHTHHRRVLNYLLHVVRHRQDAEDLAQQTFIKAHRQLHTFDCARPLINWLLTIARHNALNHFRSARRWESIPQEAASAAPSPAEFVEQQDQADSLWSRARRLLSRREFDVLWLRCAEEMSVEETARITGLTRIHVKVLVHRARRQLLQSISKP